ncbi:MAG: rhomboid family intramembrane serine protease [Planctomycetota bacterium]
MNAILIAICSLTFLAQIGTGRWGAELAESLGMVPVRITQGNDQPVIVEDIAVFRLPDGRLIQQPIRRELAAPLIPPLLTIFSCMFLHGGWMHFLGNMWFLWIFGDNVEDRLGRVGFLLLYMVTGVLAGLSHLVTDPASHIPTIGASGAIAGVMGAYAWFYPHAKVQAVLPLIVILQVFILPAPVFLGIWFVLQTISGVGSVTGGASGGVAWWAHIGGFVAGGAVALVVGRTPMDHGEVEARRF